MEVLRALDIHSEDKIIAIRENTKANSSFVLSSIIGKCITENENIYIVLTQNTLGHYHNVGKRLGYDLLKHIKDGKGKTIDLLKDLSSAICGGNIEAVVNDFFKEIIISVDSSKNGVIIFDDISHLLDLGLSYKEILMYIKLLSHLSMTQNIKLVINCHVSNKMDERLSNLLFHSSDLWVTVSALKTGISRNVTGSLEVRRPENTQIERNKHRFFHFKLEDRDIKVFAPGKDM